MAQGLLCLTMGHRARFVVPDSGTWRRVGGVPDNGAQGEVCCA